MGGRESLTREVLNMNVNACKGRKRPNERQMVCEKDGMKKKGVKKSCRLIEKSRRRKHLLVSPIIRYGIIIIIMCQASFKQEIILYILFELDLILSRTHRPKLIKLYLNLPGFCFFVETLVVKSLLLLGLHLFIKCLCSEVSSK